MADGIEAGIAEWQVGATCKRDPAGAGKSLARVMRATNDPQRGAYDAFLRRR